MNLYAPPIGLAVNYTVSVLESGREVRRLPRTHNLILDQGLDQVATTAFVDCFASAVLGTGTTPTRRDSGAVTVSRSGSTLTASASFFEAADVGRLFKFDTGEEVRITAFVSATEVTTATAGAISADEGTVWYVNRTGLAAEVKRSNTYPDNGTLNGSVQAGDTVTHKRTFDFSAETGTVNYREIGWSSTNTPGANLFGLDLLAGLGVTLVSGQQLRVTVELSVKYSPITPAAVGALVTGWTATGTGQMEGARCKTIQDNGNGAGGEGEIGQTKRIVVYSTNAAHPTFSAAAHYNAPGELANAGVSAPAYVAGSFTRTWSATFGTAAANGTIWAVALGYEYFESFNRRGSIFRVLFATSETKADTQSLTLSFSMSWGRILNNA